MDEEKSERHDIDIPDRPSSEVYLDHERDVLTGWRLYLTMTGCSLLTSSTFKLLTSHSLLTGLYLVNLEVTIVSTALINITDDLNGFQQTSWIVTGFLTTYTGIYNNYQQSPLPADTFPFSLHVPVDKGEQHNRSQEVYNCCKCHVSGILTWVWPVS